MRLDICEYYLRREVPDTELRKRMSNEDETRRSLLQYYSSKCTAHGTNILTITVASLTYMETAVKVLPSFDSLVRILANSSIISILAFLAIHQIARFWWWARLTQIVLYEPLSETDGTMLQRLDRACRDKLENKKKTKETKDARTCEPECKTKDKVIVWLNDCWKLSIFGTIFFAFLLIFQLVAHQ